MKNIISGIIFAISFLVGLAIGLAIIFGINAILVYIVCKIMGWTFAWKWVALVTIISMVLKSFLKSLK